MTTHVMLDLETFSSETNAAIVSIGAVKFDPNGRFGGLIEDRFYCVVDATSSEAHGLKLSASTIMWWFGQHEARKSLLESEPVDLASALDGFAEWFGDDKPVWGNGAGFDNVVLRNAFKVIGRECPWSFRNDRCFRTAKNLVTNGLVETPMVGTAHNALDDALWQACHLQNISASLGINFS